MTGDGGIAMDHAEIEDRQIAERYVMGKLSPNEQERFEEHYLSCPECLDRLELAEAMERGFKRAAGQEAARAAGARQLAAVAWLARRGRSRQLGVLLAAAMVLLAVPALLSYRTVAERDRQLAEVRSALEREAKRSGEGSRLAAEAERLRAEAAGLGRELARAREAAARAPERLAATLRPQGNVQILFLGTQRGEADEPTDRVRRTAEPGSIVLALEVDPPHLPSYSVILRDARGRELWRGAGLQLDQMESLAVSLPSSFLEPGDYTLVAEGTADGERPAPAGRFAFRVLPVG